jgi:hypothetical protein
MKTFTYEQARQSAKDARDETIRQMRYFIEALQKDLDRLTQAKADDDEGMTPQRGNMGYSISQHCLRYEQTMQAGWRMEQYAKLADWVERYGELQEVRA